MGHPLPSTYHWDVVFATRKEYTNCCKAGVASCCHCLRSLPRYVSQTTGTNFCVPSIPRGRITGHMYLGRTRRSPSPISAVLSIPAWVHAAVSFWPEVGSGSSVGQQAGDLDLVCCNGKDKGQPPWVVLGISDYSISFLQQLPRVLSKSLLHFPSLRNGETTG